MITAVDTNILLDVLGPDPVFGEHSKEALERSMTGGGLIVCDVVWAETAGFFSSQQLMSRTMKTLGIDYTPIVEEAATLAGLAWRAFRARGGKRDRVVADFLVGAHASVQADRLLSRDRGFYRAHFKKLKLVDPRSES